MIASSETQGRSVGPGEKARRNFSSTGGKSSGYWLSLDCFQTVKRMLALDWAQKMLCLIVPNRRTASPESFSWVCTRRLLTRSRLVWLHPRRPRDSQSGREKRRDESFQVRAKEPLGTDSHRTISKNSSGCRLLIGHKKCFVLLCPIGEQFLLSSIREFVHDGYCLDHGLSHAPKKCTQPTNFQFDIKSTSDLMVVFTLGC